MISGLSRLFFYFYPRPPRGGRHLGIIEVGFQRNFYPRPPRGGRRASRCSHLPGELISIHALREEGDPAALMNGAFSSFISIHALREEGDLRWRFPSPRSSYFYPRPPRGGRLSRRWPSTPPCRFLSTPSARRATSPVYAPGSVSTISIHALREEGDLSSYCRVWQREYFYPRPPRGGRRESCSCNDNARKFLSTPSARRATMPRGTTPAPPTNFYPRPPRGGRPCG